MSKNPKLRVEGVGIVRMKAFHDRRRGGTLFAANSQSTTNLTLPVVGGGQFRVRRIFYIGGLPPGSTRANHAQRKTTEVVFCLAGSCALYVDDGRKKQKLKLREPSLGILIGPHVWRRIADFSSDCVLLALTDTSTYDPQDYINDYGRFLASCSGR